ncbi:TOMM precursor leader peptide-binding protein [Derxia gummosa]|uniref:TOMM precursor leader peptide-binding protein n=1 Tax=Derxia gummosa DSM 723 TaxID=1121388 RepID=A0A8B6X9Q9_9BURK|nr:TOMM precursor leader peptide-binding protein [Derxia gummosa]
MLSLDPAAVPTLAPQYTAVALDDRSVIVQSEIRRVVLDGAGVVVLLGAIDGRCAVGELAHRLAPRLDFNDFRSLLDQLQQAGYLVDARRQAGDAPFWQLIGLPEAPRRLARGVYVVTAGGGMRHVMATLPNTPGRGDSVEIVPDSAALLRRALETAGVQLAQWHDGAALRVIVCDDLLHPDVERLCTDGRGPVLPVKLSGVMPTVGPLLGVTGGPCWHCLAHALRWNRPVQRFVEHQLGACATAPTLRSRAGQSAVAGIAALAIAQALAGSPRLREALLALDLATLQTQPHAVRRRPQCPHCGDADLLRRRAERPPVLASTDIAWRAEAGYRIREPRATLERYRRLLSPITGVVNYLHPMPGRHAGRRKVYVSGYQVCPQEFSGENPFDKVCAGKGQTDDQSMASALCEALERASSVWQGDEPALLATRADLVEAGHEVLDFGLLQGFSADQYARRDSINALTPDRRRQVPLPPDDRAPLAWTPAWTLDGRRRAQVPLAYCYAETPPGQGSAWGIYNPNGTAAGNCLEEAVFQGLLELIERDATAIWWYHRLHRPAVDLDALADPWIDEMRADYAAAGWTPRLIDLTHDLGIPVYAAVAHHAGFDRHAIGFGCHLGARLAARRAFTELNQLLDARPDAPHPWDQGLLPVADFLAPAGCCQLIERIDSGHDLRDDIRLIVDRLAGAGLTAWMVDKTRPDIELAVVQVIVPGLRHFWPRFGPGRLYDVPIALGWLQAPVTEAGLNPAPLFL